MNDTHEWEGPDGIGLHSHAHGFCSLHDTSCVEEVNSGVCRVASSLVMNELSHLKGVWLGC